jgi:hypothetical protein
MLKRRGASPSPFFKPYHIIVSVSSVYVLTYKAESSMVTFNLIRFFLEIKKKLFSNRLPNINPRLIQVNDVFALFPK